MWASTGIGAVGDDVLGRLVDLVPLVERLDVDRADVEAGLEEAIDEVAADESAGAGDESGHVFLNLQGKGHRDFAVPHIVTGERAKRRRRAVVMRS